MPENQANPSENQQKPVKITQTALEFTGKHPFPFFFWSPDDEFKNVLLSTSDAADDMQCVDPEGLRILKKKK